MVSVDSLLHGYRRYVIYENFNAFGKVSNLCTRAA